MIAWVCVGRKIPINWGKSEFNGLPEEGQTNGITFVSEGRLLVCCGSRN